MKIVWFTPSPVISFGKASSGTWISTMYYSISSVEELELINVVLMPVSPEISGKNIVSLNFRGKSRQKPGNDMIRIFENCIHELKPDLIHIWGTEWNGIYIASMVRLKVPVLISIQGIASILKDYIRGTRNLSGIIKWITLHDLIAPSGLLTLQRDLKRAGEMELVAVRKMHYFECATTYMEAWVRSVNPQSKIFNCPSVLRPPFNEKQWKINSIIRYSLFLPDATTSYKGFDVMIKAAQILVIEFPLLKIRVAGPLPRTGLIRCSGYERYINSLIKDYNLQDNVVFLGPLTAEKLSLEMVTAHGVVISSLIESQCLVLLEAMMLGVPTVASYSGGMPDLFTNMQTALGYPVGDATTLSHSIRRLFTNDALAVDISGNAFRIARIRNDEESCRNQMYHIYQQIVEQ